MDQEIQIKSKSPTILVVDDSEVSRETLKLILNEAGLNVIGEATNGIEALNKLQQIECDYVSLDIIMPEMDGIELYFEIQNKFPKLKSFFVSVLSQDRNFLTAIQNQIPEWKFLKKPLSLDSLQSCIQRFNAS